MYYLIFLLFVICAFAFNGTKPSKELFAGLVLVLVFIVGFRSPGIDNDYFNYLLAAKKGWGIAEISYFFIADISYALTNDTILIFVIYAAISISTQLAALYKYSLNFWLSMSFWFSTYFVLLDMNGIRAGAALGITMLAWKPWAENKHAQTLLLIALASFFHYSFVILFLVYFIIRNDDRHTIWFVALVPLGYMLYYLHPLQTIFGIFHIDILNFKFNSYNKTITGELPVFSTVLIMRIFLIGVMFLFKERLAEICDSFYLLFKLYCVGFFISVTIADLPTVAMRLLDIFACTELLLLPAISELVKPKWLGTFAVCLYAAFYFFLYIIQAEYIKAYKTIL